ncbi:hypothetical protein niasHT_006052 [Heterodera trifolii]|uniref:RING-type domain-containing protein n=1 Tax=Heterodera trifolii TaxID=157864 RepID=A0ABD2M0W6_9BILA
MVSAAHHDKRLNPRISSKKTSAIAQQRDKCALCTRNVTARTEQIGRCGHKLHYVCLMRMLHTANECLNCGETFDDTEDEDNETTRRMKIMNDCDDEELMMMNERCDDELSLMMMNGRLRC